MSSRRLPGKILMDLRGKPLLQHLLENVGNCQEHDSFLIATSWDSSDDPVERFCKDRGVQCYRGPLDDVALRLKEAAEHAGSEAFVRLSGDSPFLSYRVIDKGVKLFRDGNWDLVTNVQKRTYPKGCSVEVIGMEAYDQVLGMSQEADDREHVTLPFYRAVDQFRVRNYECVPNYGERRLVVDTPEDLENAERMLDRMDRPSYRYSVLELVEIQKTLELQKSG